jgi:hypothetical protein
MNKSFNVIFLFHLLLLIDRLATRGLLSPRHIQTIPVGVQVQIYCRLDSGDIVPVPSKDTQRRKETQSHRWN